MRRHVRELSTVHRRARRILRRKKRRRRALALARRPRRGRTTVCFQIIRNLETMHD